MPVHARQRGLANNTQGKRMDETKRGPEGIGGWLILVIIGLIGSILRISWSLYRDHFQVIGSGSLAQLMDPASAAYHPLWAPLIAFEIVANVISILLAIATLVLLFKRSRHVRWFAVAWLLGSLVLIVADYVFAQQIPLVAEQPLDAGTAREIVRSVIGALIWVPYFLVSKRVKATCTRDWPLRPPAVATVVPPPLPLQQQQ